MFRFSVFYVALLLLLLLLISSAIVSSIHVVSKLDLFEINLIWTVNRPSMERGSNCLRKRNVFFWVKRNFLSCLSLGWWFSLSTNVMWILTIYFISYGKSFNQMMEQGIDYLPFLTLPLLAPSSPSHSHCRYVHRLSLFYSNSPLNVSALSLLLQMFPWCEPLLTMTLLPMPWIWLMMGWLPSLVLPHFVKTLNVLL